MTNYELAGKIIELVEGHAADKSHTGLIWKIEALLAAQQDGPSDETPTAWRVWAKGRKFTRGIYENPSKETFECWAADGDEVEPLYAAPQVSVSTMGSQEPAAESTGQPAGAAPSEAGADDALDAARYRWLRSGSWRIHNNNSKYMDLTLPRDLDEAIDTEIAKSNATYSPKGEKHG